MSAYYYHKEVMEERGLKTKDLPTELRKFVTTFQKKANFAKNPELIAELQEFSQILGEKIAETEIKNKSTISDLTEQLRETSVNKTNVDNMRDVEYDDIEEPVESFEDGGQIKSIEEQIQEDERAVAEVCDTEENVEPEPKDEVIGKVSSDTKDEDDSGGLLSFLKW